MKKIHNSSKCKRNSSREIIKDIYGVKDGNVYEYGFAEALDEDGFNVKLQSLKDRWESLCPGFFDWFKKTRVSQFLKSVTQTARIGYDSEALYYQNDIESRYTRSKREKNVLKKKILQQRYQIFNPLLSVKKKMKYADCMVLEITSFHRIQKFSSFRPYLAFME